MIRFYLRIFNSTSTINGFTYPKTTPGTYRTYDITNEIIENEDIIIDKRVEYDGLDSIATDEVSLVISKNATTERLLLNDNFKALYITEADKLYFAGFIDNNRVINYNEDTLEIKANGVLSFLFDLWDSIPVPYEGVGSYTYDYKLNYFLSNTLTAIPEFRLREFLDYNFYEDFLRIGLPEFSNTDFNNIVYYVFAYNSQQWFQGNAKYKYTAKDFLLEVLRHYLAMIYIHPSRRLIIQSKLYLTNPHNLPNLSENILKITDYALDDIIWEQEYSVYDGILFNVVNASTNEHLWGLYSKNAEFYWEVRDGGDGQEVTFFYRKIPVSKDGFGDGNYLDLRMKLLTDKGIQVVTEPLLFLGSPRMDVLPGGRYALLNLYYSIGGQDYHYDSASDIQYGIFEKLLNKKTSILKTTLTGLDYNIGDFFEFNNKIFILYEMKLNLTQNTTEVAMREIK
jgi:hypothetical protein